MRAELTQERLKQRVNYDPETGVMTVREKHKRGGRTPVGGALGCPNKKGYLVARMEGKMRPIHRLAWLYMYGEWPHIVDHINHNRADNRIANLRNVTPSGNKQNEKRRVNNTTGVTGVYWDKPSNKWLARMGLHNNDIYLGKHDSFFDACCARKSAENLYGFHPNHGRTM